MLQVYTGNHLKGTSFRLTNRKQRFFHYLFQLMQIEIVQFEIDLG